MCSSDLERFSRRKHGKRPVPFSAWELPEQAMRWCLDEAGLKPQNLDAVAIALDAEDIVLIETLDGTEPDIKHPNSFGH